MHKTITFLGKSVLLFSLFFGAGFSTSSFAQCAGQDGTLTSCNKETNQFIDLFSGLGGIPVPGGLWTDDNNTGGLNMVTGQLNTWQINSGGTFQYTYTNPMCSESATVTLNLAGFPGNSNMNAVACDDNSRVNLFQFTGGSPAATVPGTWSLIDVINDNGDSPASATAFLSGRNFNAAQAGRGTYTFRYTITDQVSQNCQSTSDASALSSMVVLEVSPAPDSGIPNQNIQTIFCETEDLSGLTNFNLRDAILNEDDGGTWSEIQTNEINGANDSFIDIQNIRDTFGAGTYPFTYTVEPINQICNESEITVNIVIEQVADFRNATLEFTFPTEMDDIVCEDALPINPVVTITGDAADIPDGDYELTYSVGSSPNTGNETLTITMTNGVGSFNANPNFFAGAGVAELVVESIQDPNTQGNCVAYLGDLKDTLTIVALPDLSDTSISVEQPLCFGENGTLTISDALNTPELELVDGTYSFDYSITNSEATINYTQTADVTNGDASLTLSDNSFPADGDYTVTLLTVTNSNSCSSNSTVTTSFIVSPKPDAQTITVTVEDACEDDTVTVTITDSAATPNLEDGIYDFVYEISGAINITDQTASNVSINNGSGFFILPDGILENGTSTITLTLVSNTTTTCEADNLMMPTSEFTIIPTPDLTGATVTISDVCEDTLATVIISVDPAAVQDGSYLLNYTLTGANTATVTDLALDFSAGLASFNIPAAQLAEAGTNIFTISGFSTNELSCPALGLPIQQSFETYTTPTLENTVVTVEESCDGEPVIVMLDNPSVTDGSYELIYELSGANTLNNQTATVNFAGGKADFNISMTSALNTGNTAITINQITDLGTPSQCSAPVSGITADFVINPLPDFSSIDLSVASVLCEGDNVDVTITDSTNKLLDGTYTVTYELSGANVQTPKTTAVTITSGSGSVILPAAEVPNDGMSIITITTFTDATTMCMSISAPKTQSFTIIKSPDLSNATLTVDDSCFGDANVSVSLNASNLSDGTYDLAYTLTGDNTGNGTANAVTVTNGMAEFNLDTTLLTANGVTTLTLNSVTNSTTGCKTEGLTVTTNFTLNPLPVITEDQITITDICLGDNALVTFSNTSLSDGDYVLNYSISESTTAAASETLTFTNGASSLSLNATILNASGNTKFTVNSLMNVTTTCTNTGVVNKTFQINPIPEVSDGQLVASDVCLNENGLVSITNATGLVNGNYTFTYDLSGANTANDLVATVAITDGSGIFEIPAGSIAQLGITNINLTLVTSATNCESEPLTVSDEFEIIALPDAVGTTLTSSDVCFGESVSVSISGATALVDGDYQVTYQLSGANTGDPVTDTFTFISGESNFEIAPLVFVNSGVTTIELIDIQNFTTLCSAANLNAPSVSITILDPVLPTLDSAGSVFCINDNPVVGDLEANASSNFDILTYDAPTGGSVISSDTPLSSNTTYYLVSQNTATGCIGSQRLAVTVDLTGCDSVFIPDGFSPNGDGINDVFEIQNINLIYPDYTIEIFNRNGSVVFKGNAGSGFWNGQSNQNRLGGNTLPNGTYFYVINYNDGQTSPKQGKVYLNR